MSPITIVNPGDRDWTKHDYVLCFGAYGWTLLRVYANSLDAALDEAVDWIADNAPGLLADEQVEEAYKEALAEGMSEEEAQKRAEVDITRAGNCGNCLNSWEWNIVAEDPSRDQLMSLAKEHGGFTVAK